MGLGGNSGGGFSFTKLLTLLLLLTIGLSLSPFLVGALMDALSITTWQIFGVDVGLGFVQFTLKIWPGGDVIYALVFGKPVTIFSFIIGIIQVLIVAVVRSLIPLPAARGNQDFRPLHLFGIAMVDVAITCAISILVGWALNWPEKIFTGGLEVVLKLLTAPVLFCIGIGIFWLIRQVNPFNSSFNFGLIISIGRFALVTFAFITWSINNVAGAFTIVLCIVGCGVLTLVKGRSSAFW